MTIVIIIFFISIITAFGMLMFRSWEIRTNNMEINENNTQTIPRLPFRHIEKNVLYLTKHLIQGVIFIFAKYWFIFTTKIKKWFNSKWPKINNYFKKKTEKVTSYRHSFLKKALIESKIKIRHIKEKVKEEMGEGEENKPN